MDGHISKDCDKLFSIQREGRCGPPAAACLEGRNTALNTNHTPKPFARKISMWPKLVSQIEITVVAFR